jgi:hypothetical protein
MFGRHRLNEEMYGIVEPCPIDYFGSEEKRAIRINTFRNDERVSTFDLYLTDDTRYTLGILIEEPYRGGLWLELIGTYEPGVLSFIDRPNAVWYKPGEWIIDTKDNILHGLNQFKEKGIMKTDKVFSYGTINDIFDV